MAYTPPVQGFRSSVQSEKAKKGNGFRGGYRDRLDIPKASATPVLICRGSYEDLRTKSIKENGGTPPFRPYHVRPLHRLKQGEKSFESGTCVAGYDFNGGDCLACYRKESGDNRVSLGDQFSINVLHLALHHKVELKDKDGKVIRYQEDSDKHKRGEAILTWSEVTAARDLRDARQALKEGIENENLALFRKKYLDVGKGHLGNLMTIEDMASRACRCGGQLEVEAFLCEKCGDTLCDVTESNMTTEEVVRYTDERQRCACNHVGYPQKRLNCSECATAATPLGIFDVVAYVRKQGENAQSTVICEKVVSVFDFQLEDGSYIVKIENDQFVVDGNGNPVYRDDVAKLMTQFDFDQVHRPLDNDRTARFLKVENPFGRKDPRAYMQADETEEGETPRRQGPPPRRPGFR